jgi:hypothetical protein
MKVRMACGLHIARYVIEELAEGLIMGNEGNGVLRHKAGPLNEQNSDGEKL